MCVVGVCVRARARVRVRVCVCDTTSRKDAPGSHFVYVKEK